MHKQIKLSIALIFIFFVSLIFVGVNYINKRNSYLKFAYMHSSAESKAMIMQEKFELASKFALQYSKDYEALLKSSAAKESIKKNTYMSNSWTKTYHLRKKSSELAKANAQHHHNLVEKYRNGAMYPFLTVPEDPPDPKYPTSLLDVDEPI